MKPAILDWRNRALLDAGRAEVFVYEEGQGWATQGHAARLFASRTPGPERQDLDQGMQIIRIGLLKGVTNCVALYWIKDRARGMSGIASWSDVNESVS